MKKTKYIYMLVMLLMGIGFASCESDEAINDKKPITITQIYLQDYKSDVPDRAIEFVRLGQMIRLEGSGFLGLKKVYVNGFDTYFNTALMTDKSMLLTISSKTPIVDADESIRNTIKLVKTNQELIYSFTVRAAAPTVTKISNSLPEAGERVKVYGTNLHETSKLIFPGDIELDDVDSDEDGEWYSFVMPTGVIEDGSIISEGANGFAATPPYFNFTAGVILNFDDIGEQGFWSWSDEGSMINDEDLVDDPLSSNRGKCVQIIPERILTGSDGGILAGKSRASECWTSGDGAKDDWSFLYDYIPEDTPLDEVAFQFDVYVPEIWTNTGQIQIVLFNNFNFSGIGSDDEGKQTAFYIPYIQEGVMVDFKTDGWETVTIPFSDFGLYADRLEDKEATPPSFKDVVDDRAAATYKNFGIGVVNTDFTYQGLEVTADLMNVKIYLDNWRIVPNQTIELSDFDDENNE